MGAYIRNLECVDSMATIDCVVAEKSGTITNEKFLVKSVFYNGKLVDAAINY